MNNLGLLTIYEFSVKSSTFFVDKQSAICDKTI